MAYWVYRHTNLINGKIYIGITSLKNPKSRWNNGWGYKYNSLFFKDIKTFGWNKGFSHDILFQGLSQTEALEIEKKLIELYNSTEDGYNVARYGTQLSETGRKKLSEALTGLKRSKETVAKVLKTKKERYGSLRGENNSNPNCKRVRCLETNDIFANMSEASRWSNTPVQKISLVCKKERQHAGRHPKDGYQLTWEWVDNNTDITISCVKDREIKKIKKVLCIETGVVYDNASDAYLKTGIATCNITRVCNGQRKTAGKMHWEWKEEEK